MINRNLLYVAIAATLGLSANASAIELVDLENVPSHYAHIQEVEDKETGEVKEELRFGSYGHIWKADSINRILTGYGLELTEENAEGTPRGFCWMTEVENEDGEMERVMVFDKTNSTMYTPNTVNNILSAYGVELDVNDEEAMAKVPKAFARVVEKENHLGEVIQVAVFGGESIAWKPETFNQILSAYR